MLLICARYLNKDIMFRRKIILSAALCGLMANMGFTVGQLGPSLLLNWRQITRRTLDDLVHIVTAFSVGFVFGVILFPNLMKKIKTVTILVVNNVIIAPATAVIPWCKWFAVMVAVFSLRGVCQGINETGCLILILKMWGKNNGPYMQAFYLSYAIGALIAPLTSDMFNVAVEGNCTTSNSEICGETVTEITTFHGALVLSVMLTLVSVPLFTCFLYANETWLNDSQLFYHDRDLNKKMTIVQQTVIPAFGITVFLAMVMEISIASYLPTYLVEYFEWPYDHGTFSMNIFWSFFLFGRLLGVFLTKCFKMRYMVGFYIFVLIVISVGFLLASLMKSNEGTRILIPFLGIFLSMLLPSLLSWAEIDFVKCSGSHVSFFIICKAIGTCPPIVLNHLPPLWFCYALVSISVTLFAFYILLLCIVQGKRPTTVKIASFEPRRIEFDHYVIQKESKILS